MLKTILDKIDKLFFTPLKRELWTNRMLMGQMMAEMNEKKGIVDDLSQVEFKVFSQWGDDGIIQYLTRNVDLPSKTFIEFGVENYTEANTRFLLLNNNWSGLIMDGSKKHMDYVKADPISWRNDLQVKDVFVTAENINELIASAGFGKEPGILHIDIDGNDYWVWKAINNIDPVIVIVEYNAVFGIEHAYTTVYDPAFFRTTRHYSNLLYGSSLLSLCDLAAEKGYEFVGCNSAGNNAYFIRKDKVGNLRVKTPQQGFVDAKFAESRTRDQGLSYLRGRHRLALLKGEEVFNTRTNKVETIA